MRWSRSDWTVMILAQEGSCSPSFYRGWGRIGCCRNLEHQTEQGSYEGRSTGCCRLIAPLWYSGFGFSVVQRLMLRTKEQASYWNGAHPQVARTT